MGAKMKNNEEYDKSRPLRRLDIGDKAVIRMVHFPWANKKDKEKYKYITDGEYEAICTKPYYLQCDEQPLLRGRYNYWYGDKWGCSEGVYADEKKFN
jgi:hypothetical protein